MDMDTHQDPAHQDPRYWPAFVDLLAATLMIFLIMAFLQELFSAEELEALWLKQQQQQFSESARSILQEEIDSGNVFMKRHQSSVILTFSDQVLFESGDHRIKPKGQALLEKCGLLLAGLDSDGFEVAQLEGHSDPLPLRRTTYPATNWQLSAARAISVVEHLSTAGNVDPAKLIASGYSSYRPIAPNNTPEGRALNRRIEMRVFFSGASKAEQPIGEDDASGPDAEPAGESANAAPE